MLTRGLQQPHLVCRLLHDFVKFALLPSWQFMHPSVHELAEAC
jgi:hypothetical protein